MGLLPFERVLIAGIGLIGSSLALALRRAGLAKRIAVFDDKPDHVTQALDLGLAEEAGADPRLAAAADLVVLCVPVGACGRVAAQLAPYLAQGSLVTDVGSVKQAVIRDVAPVLPPHVDFIPGHPIAGTERSGPGAGFADLFIGRHCILTPAAEAKEAAVARLQSVWEAIGSRVTLMNAEHHDRVLAITSHLPHLIAYTIVGTATDLEEHMQQEVIKFSAAGFRDFTRIAASDPIMWRDVFLNNREAVLEMLGRLHEDLGLLARAIRIGDGKILEEKFTTTRAIRQGIISAKQA